MSLHRKLVIVIVSLCAITLCSNANAQQVGFFGRGDDNSDFSSLYDPFCDLDTGWFEPIHCDCPDERALNSGWFFGYQRTYLTVSRPRNQSTTIEWDPADVTGAAVNPISSIFNGATEPGDYSGDRAWGNRFDFGWMSEDGTGLWFVARKLDSPSTTVEFTNSDFNAVDTIRVNEDDAGPTFATLNGLQMWGFEGNRVWRLEPTSRGTTMEPFVGARYVRLRDIADRTDFFTDAPEVFGRLAISGAGANAVETFRLNSNYRQAEITTDNDLFGGQFGMRSRWRRGRWQINSDIRGLLFANHQSREDRINNEIQQEAVQATYDANGDLAAIADVAGGGTLTLVNNQENNFESHNTFVYGGEFHIDAAFELTQGFALTLGGEIIWFADGVGRGHSGVDDSLVLAGITAGFTLNR